MINDASMYIVQVITIFELLTDAIFTCVYVIITKYIHEAFK